MARESSRRPDRSGPELQERPARREGGRGRRAGETRGSRTAGQAQRAEGPRGPEAPPADPEAVARLICLRLLTTAPRTRAQLAEALHRRNVPDDAAAVVLGRFADVGLVNDAAFAAAWVESRHHGRGLSRHALEAELGRRGVAREDVDTAMARLTPETEVATARDLVWRKMAGTRGQPARARARRLVGMLARKGYPPGLAYRVVREALEREGQDLAGTGLEGDPPFEMDSGE